MLSLRSRCAFEIGRDEVGRREEHTTSSFIGGVLDNNIRFVILKIPEREQDDVSLIDPDLSK